MRIIDSPVKKEKFANISEGSVFRYHGKYFLKTRTMFLRDEINEYLNDVEVINHMEELENDLLLIRAINLSDAEYHNFLDEIEVEPLNVELHVRVKG